jgi:ribosomal-protein-alanine N-acetyltransferase
MPLKTPRLVLRAQVQADAAALFTILRDPVAMGFWSRPPATRLVAVETLMAEQQAAMGCGLCRYWTILEDNDAIGSIDLSLIRDGSAELGFVLRSDRWGAGLATEAVNAVIAHGFGPLRLTRLASVVQSQNRAAARVLEKTGFVLIEHRAVVLPSGGKRDCGFYLRER